MKLTLFNVIFFFLFQVDDFSLYDLALYNIKSFIFYAINHPSPNSSLLITNFDFKYHSYKITI